MHADINTMLSYMVKRKAKFLLLLCFWDFSYNRHSAKLAIRWQCCISVVPAVWQLRLMQPTSSALNTSAHLRHSCQN